MAAQALGDAEEHDPPVLALAQRLKPDDIAIECDHRVEIDASDGNLAEGADSETSLGHVNSPGRSI